MTRFPPPTTTDPAQTTDQWPPAMQLHRHGTIHYALLSQITELKYKYEENEILVQQSF